MTKFFKTLAAMMLLAVIMMLNIACEGPEGTAGLAGKDGVDGTDGKDGKDGAASCVTCHNMSTDLKSKILQWSQSGHGAGLSYIEEGDRNPCATCHSSEGFEQMMAGVSPIVPPKNPTNINCRTCHTIHNNFDMTDFAALHQQPVKLLGDLTNGATIDIKGGNLCANCHQSRPRNYGLDKSDPIRISSAYWGPHGSTQVNIYTGKGGFEVPGSVAYTNTPHANMIADGCVTCHMHEGAHNFEPQVATCTPCHTGATNFDIGGAQTAVSALIDELAQKLIADGLLAGDAVNGYRPVAMPTGTTTSVQKAGAVFNFLLVVNDGSKGAHNPKYTKALLQNSIEVFN